MILTRQKNTLAEYMILSGADNRPSMLDKDLYDSWKSRMELYMQNREHGIMILESVEHGPLICPTIEESGAINIILQGLPTDIYSLINHHIVAKDLWEKVQLLMQVNQQTHLAEFPQIDSGLAVPVIKQGDDPIDAINKMMSFLSTIVTSCQQRAVKCFNCQWEGHMARQCLKPKRKRDAMWFREKVILVKAQGNGKVLNKEELEFLAALGIAEGLVTQSVIIHNAAYQEDDLDAYDSDCDKISTTNAVLMANLSSYRSAVLSKVPISDNTNNDMLNQSVQEMLYSEPSHFVELLENEIHNDSNIIPYSQYLTESQNAAIQDTNSSAQQDALILYVFEELSNQVTNYNKVNNDNFIANETLSAELERYKE
ncbi:retrovirus-related pol polyprotein from transposon TNT 1-94 [Tanacetum coccineum]